MTKIFSRYNKETPKGVSFSLPSMAKQSFAQEADINNVVGRYLKTGVMYDTPGTRAPQYGDFSSSQDYLTIQNRIVQVHETFDSLDSKTREKFGNNPANMLDFIADPENMKEAIDLGLLPSDNDLPGQQILDFGKPEPLPPMPDDKPVSEGESASPNSSPT